MKVLKPNPCYHCEKRSATCHVTCKGYNEWAEFNREVREGEYAQRQLDHAIYMTGAPRRRVRQRNRRDKSDKG